MCGAGCLSEIVSLQRAVGELHVAVKRYGTDTVLRDLRQVGCLKARFPRRVAAGWIDMVMLNTGGGVAGGDRLDVSVVVDPDCHATVSAQSADRFYRALTGDAPSMVRTRVTVKAGAALEWLPQETILFDRSALDRRLEIDLADDARFLGVETVVFGRTAMNERVRQGWLRDLIRVKRGGELLLHDAVRIDGPIDDLLRRAAVGAGAVASATLIYAAPDAPIRLDALRAALGAADAAASAWNGMLVARILGADSASVRATVIAVLAALRDDRPLPRVWFC